MKRPSAISQAPTLVRVGPGAEFKPHRYSFLFGTRHEPAAQISTSRRKAGVASNTVLGNFFGYTHKCGWYRSAGKAYKVTFLRSEEVLEVGGVGQCWSGHMRRAIMARRPRARATGLGYKALFNHIDGSLIRCCLSSFSAVNFARTSRQKTIWRHDFSIRYSAPRRSPTKAREKSRFTPADEAVPL